MTAGKHIIRHTGKFGLDASGNFILYGTSDEDCDCCDPNTVDTDCCTGTPEILNLYLDSGTDTLSTSIQYDGTLIWSTQEFLGSSTCTDFDTITCGGTDYYVSFAMQCNSSFGNRWHCVLILYEVSDEDCIVDDSDADFVTSYTCDTFDLTASFSGLSCATITADVTA